LDVSDVADVRCRFLRDKYRLPALPIVVYLKVGLEGVGVHSYVEWLWN